MVAVFIIGKAHGSRIYTETLPRRLRAIREDMPEMGVTVPAANFGAHHAVRGVRQVADRIIADRLVKARPAAARIVLRLGVKQRCITHQAVVDAFPFIVQQTPGKRRFCAVILRHVKLHLCKVFFKSSGLRWFDICLHLAVETDIF